MSDKHIIIGLMSGSSVDGIDAAMVEFSSAQQLKVLATQFTPFKTALRKAINRIALSGKIESVNESPLHRELAHAYAQASLSLIKQSGVTAEQISAIANHGQTVRHEPNATPAFSLQLGDGQLIAELTQITTICQFRQADLAAGGQGAPLMPAFHQALFGNAGLIINIGGIANLSRLDEPIIGFDTGTGNTLMDQWINQHQQRHYDADGAWAMSGKVNEALLAQLMSDDYFKLPPPKSTGTDYFNLAWLHQHLANFNNLHANDVQATLLAFTVRTIAAAVAEYRGQHTAIYVCGGGVHNTALMTNLATAIPAGMTVHRTDALGVPADWVEAVGFAWLGYCKLHNLPSNLPSVTGANSPQVLGEVFTAN